MKEGLNYNDTNNDNDSLNIREELEKYLIYWRWFVLCVLLSLICAFLYLRYSTPTYSASTSILIKDNQKSGISAELSAIADLGIVGTGSVNNTDNEIHIIKSRKIIGNVVDSLNLTISYFSQGRIKLTEEYGDVPLQLEVLNKNLIYQKRDTAIFIKINNANTFNLFDANEKLVEENNEFNTLLKSEIGDIRVKNNSVLNQKSSYFKLIIYPKYKVVSKYNGKVNVSAIDKNSSVLVLSLVDVVKRKSEDFLNVLVHEYNEDAVRDKSEISEKTKEFIEERIKSVGLDLAAIQDSVKDFKSKTGFTGLSKQGELILESYKEIERSILEKKTQISLAKWINELLESNSKESYQLLPANLGFKDENIGGLINQYNLLVRERTKLLPSAGVLNPQLLQLEKDINNLKESLKSSLNNLVSYLKIELNKITLQNNKIESELNLIPVTERGFIDIARQQEIISELYSYLLKKKEETAISLAVTVANAKIIDVAYGSNSPVSPKRNIIFLVAILLGILLPFIFFYLKNLFDTKIHNKKDIQDNLSIPYLGDIPKSDSKDKIIVGSHNRSSAAEAFRLVRTNLDFILNNNKSSCKTIFVSSTTSGEGKSFISLNIASILATPGKKVLLLGMDLRAPKVTEYLGLPDRKGVTNYITNENLLLEDIKFSIPNVKGLDIISSGAVPPNPAELLMSKRVDTLFNDVKSQYDYIIVDTAPVNLVTDTLLIAKYADMFMYVIRANYLDKRLLVIPQNLYNEKRLPNMSVVLNDTDSNRSYGYGYGGYGYLVEEKKAWYKRIFSN